MFTEIFNYFVYVVLKVDFGEVGEGTGEAVKVYVPRHLPEPQAKYVVLEFFNLLHEDVDVVSILELRASGASQGVK